MIAFSAGVFMGLLLAALALAGAVFYAMKWAFR